MNEKTINEQYAYIRTLLEGKRLKEALMQLESSLWQCPDWDLRTRLEELQTSYKYMLEYMRQGANGGTCTGNWWQTHGALPTKRICSCWTLYRQNITMRCGVLPDLPACRHTA